MSVPANKNLQLYPCFVFCLFTIVFEIYAQKLIDEYMCMTL